MSYALGTWSLDGILAGETLEQLISDVRQKARIFASMRQSLHANMSTSKFNEILSSIEGIQELLARIGGHTSLVYAQNTQSEEASALKTRINQITSEIGNDIIFFDLWWKRDMGDDDAGRLAESAGDLADMLLHKRRLARHSLKEGEERIINLLDVTGASALVKLYDMMTNAYTYDITLHGEQKSLGREELMVYVRDADYGTRKTAYDALLDKYSKNRNILSEIYHNIVLNYRNEFVSLREYDSPISVMNAGSNIDDSTVDALLQVCSKRADTFQRYFAKKASMLHMKRLSRYDVYAPMTDLEKSYAYNEAVGMVLDTFYKFSDVVGDYAKSVFDGGHVHSKLQPGKMSGAFCSTISPKITPFVLLNYTGESRDVFTMAHELGHAIHSIAASPKSILVQHAPLPLAETASTFSEMLLFDVILDKMDASEQVSVLAGKMDDLYATIMRQAFFTQFEIQAHQKLSEGATAAQISDVYMQTLHEQFADSVYVSDVFSSEWLAIPHFYHSPFYCYSYAFGNLLAASLFQRYKREGSDFVPSYLGILSAGGSRKPEDLLHEYGFDIGSATFWQEGFDYIDSLYSHLNTAV
ncbi:MAG: M3 family oligoendopeptidase [Cenarchaeum sp. SB0665_bin_23]|nr:M3 family oligoendopeptidase [Cenarchaeum sp. SB0667_bin_13]MXY37590.1 M3 family oligoendopeptidase [Cenarchaeum sp. SB0664_bin_35]MXY61476.1 M3 family oligoendopeptidase [Cenarchaeum sp. SB0665_bin_23]MXZ93762.1 M3 family oligoendopeptidase [Cenarchaeum sp. SB0666_bin_15]MYB46321.1 M3 family oligoendopeptidase [Cenarchaeum sp. SB0662_bin_33]MYC79238.1 M3 family oligoendopeptidase [Cenarchaeum sp. SB0661_bin_35]MYD58025.1 M3 family oligoendopeptidase [Cenarchaeum sp. SB0678_bin_8]MYG33221